jgi:hypothetical protein
MANNYGTMPVYLDTDTTIAGGTNWKGATSLASTYTGGIGIRPEKLIIQQANSATAPVIGTIQVFDAKNTTTAPYFTFVVESTTQGPSEIDLVGAAPGWHDFIVTGLTATKCSLQIYYRV